ncbi:MAG: aminodeoxychorismate synthase component I [Hyphomicrobiales bacterium]|nr:aminodeoxychorismate synthase component I [Hyphomicrobiales bacterium]
MTWRVSDLPWCNPLVMAGRVPSETDCWVLFYSGMVGAAGSRYSILALEPLEEAIDYTFKAFDKKLTSDQARYENFWAGYLGYGLKHQLERLPQDQPGQLTMPDLWMVRFGVVVVFDHCTETVQCWSANGRIPDYLLQEVPAPPQAASPHVASLLSNMIRSEYLAHVQAIREAIFRGDLYQANLTRKFFGELQQEVDAFSLFRKLTEISPAPYSALLKLGDNAVLSSSPERFLTVTPDGAMTTTPIKGSAPRGKTEAEDAAIAYALAHSTKDRAENLMIVDLMRNDLSRSAVAGSVEVASLFDVTQYSTVYHLSSTITAQKRPEVSTLEAVQACFPPGSMTGAPKIKAMEVCTALEQQARGIYSGAIGWFGGDGAADLSVVIRTLILHGRQFEFQVGGGVVADSSPENEWQETLIKARALASLLGIEELALATL